MMPTRLTTPTEGRARRFEPWPKKRLVGDAVAAALSLPEQRSSSVKNACAVFGNERYLRRGAARLREFAAEELRGLSLQP